MLGDSEAPTQHVLNLVDANTLSQSITENSAYDAGVQSSVRCTSRQRPQMAALPDLTGGVNVADAVAEANSLIGVTSGILPAALMGPNQYKSSLHAKVTQLAQPKNKESRSGKVNLPHTVKLRMLF